MVLQMSRNGTCNDENLRHRNDNDSKTSIKIYCYRIWRHCSTFNIAALKREGHWLIAAATNRPPALAPRAHNLSLWAYPPSSKNCAHARKSLNEFFFSNRDPAWYHERPRSPPPLRSSCKVDRSDTVSCHKTSSSLSL